MEYTGQVGQRCFFKIKHLYSFGTVIKTDHDGQRLLIRADDGCCYEAWISNVILLKRKMEGE